MSYAKQYFFVLTLFCACLIFSSPAKAGFKEGKAAFEQKNWALAIIELRPLAERDNGDAQMILGNMYSDGLGVRKDMKTAYDLYTRAASNGNSNAMLALGTMYVSGAGVTKNIKTGIYWFKKSSEWGNQIAQFTLATVLFQGMPEKNISSNPVEAYKWFSIAAKNNSVPRIQHASKELAKITIEKLTPKQITKTDKDIAIWQSRIGKFKLPESAPETITTPNTTQETVTKPKP